MYRIKLVLGLFFVCLLIFSGCVLQKGESIEKETNKQPEKITKEFDISKCGDFPFSSGDGGPGSKYMVCINKKSGECFYRKAFDKLIEGCDPEFDKYFYGKEECFESDNEDYDFTGKLIKTENKDIECKATIQSYFESKVKN